MWGELIYVFFVIDRILVPGMQENSADNLLIEWVISINKFLSRFSLYSLYQFVWCSLCLNGSDSIVDLKI